MKPVLNGLSGFVLCCCGLIAGCNVQPTTTTSATTSLPTNTQPTSGTTPASVEITTKITQPSILVTQYSRDPSSVLVFAGTASGISAPYFELPGGIPAIDAAGNLYVATSWGSCNGCSRDINVYSLDAVNPGKPLRTLHTHLAQIWDMTVSRSGEIFVSDGAGVAVFSATATGDDAPVRYLQLGNVGSIAVDSSDNLYASTGFGAVSVFGATATGAAVPARVISGPNTQMRSEYAHDYVVLAVDAVGKLYVLCYVEQPDGLNAFRVLEFGSDADGNVAPLRFVTTPGMLDEYEGLGIAVDAAGTIYVSASQGLNQGAVFEFPADASGSVTPSKVISSGAWGENAGAIALY